MSDSRACRVSLGTWVPNQLGAPRWCQSLSLSPSLFLVLHYASTSLHMKWSPLQWLMENYRGTKLNKRHYTAGSVKLMSEVWMRISKIWDSLVTHPIKHDQLNIFALNVCQGAPMWMEQTAKINHREIKLFLSGWRGKVHCWWWFFSYHHEVFWILPRQLLWIHICPYFKYVTTQRLITHDKWIHSK